MPPWIRPAGPALGADRNPASVVPLKTKQSIARLLSNSTGFIGIALSYGDAFMSFVARADSAERDLRVLGESYNFRQTTSLWSSFATLGLGQWVCSINCNP